MRVQNININTLRLAVEQAGEVSFEKFPRLQEWLAGEQKPTLTQLGNLARALHIPFGYFFLDQLPHREYPIPHYRTKTAKSFKPSAELIDTLRAHCSMNFSNIAP